MMGENDFKRFFRKRILLCKNFGIETGFGGQEGVSDVLGVYQFGEEGQIFFFELKVGKFEDELLKVKDIRGAQVQFASEMRRVGLPVFFVCGVKVGKEWQSWLLPFEIENFIEERKNGFHDLQIRKFPPFKLCGDGKDAEIQYHSLQIWRRFRHSKKGFAEN